MKSVNIFLITIGIIILLGSCSLLQPATSDNSEYEPNERPRTQQEVDRDAWDSPWEEEPEREVMVSNEDNEEPEIPEIPEMGINFQDSELLQPLLDQAKAEGKLIFLDFYASWCAPCKVMHKKIFTEKKMGDFMNANFISHKVDVELSHLPVLYKVSSLPTLLFLDTEGEVVVRNEGALGYHDFKKLGERALRRGNTSVGGSGR